MSAAIFVGFFWRFEFITLPLRRKILYGYEKVFSGFCSGIVGTIVQQR
jgi:hypothetical protein